MLKEKRLDVKYKKPLSKKEMKEALKNPMEQTKLKMKKGFQKAPIFYYVPMHLQLNDADRKVVTKGLVDSTTPDKAKELVTKSLGKHPWTYRDISLIKDFECGFLAFKGLPVALYFKRPVAQIEPEPNDPVPTGALENAEDLWARMDLFSKSPRQLVADVKEDIFQKEQLILDLQQQLSASRALLASVDVISKQKLTKELADARQKLAEANAQIAKLQTSKPSGKSRK